MKKAPMTTYQKVMRTIGIAVAILCVLLAISFSPRLKNYITNITTNAEMLMTPAVNTKIPLAEQSESSKIYKVNKGKPDFTKSELSLNSGSAWQSYSNLDQAGRVTTVNVLIDKKTLKSKDFKSEITLVPLGFKEVAVGKKTKTGQLYERGQLLPTRLGGATADTRNIFTATNQLNQLLAKKTNQIADYLESHPQNHVRYRISTVYKDQEIIARGVCLEAQSVEDNGLSFNVYLLNTQSGIVINYSTGEAKVIM